MVRKFQTDKDSKPIGKTVTISARISREDALFLSQYEAEGAVTPSDKLRAIIADAREWHSKSKDYRGSISVFQNMLAPVDADIRELELRHHIHSELLTRILEWLPDMMAVIIASETKLNKSGEKGQLEEIEEGVADRVFRLIESIMQMGITQRCPCYNSNTISRRIDPVLDLARIISN